MRESEETMEMPSSRLKGWNEAGIGESAAALWVDAGYRLDEARRLENLGVTLEDVAGWKQRGWRGDTIARLVNAKSLPQFRSGRWDALLATWRPASVGYMVEKGFTLDATEEWVNAGSNSPYDVARVVAAGGTPEIMSRMIAEGIPCEAVHVALDQRMDADTLARWGRLGLDAYTLSALWKEHADSEAVFRSLAAGASQEQLLDLPFGDADADHVLAWLAAGLKWSPKDYMNVGVTDAAQAQAWERHGFQPSLIAGFVRVGVTPASASDRVRQGLTDWDVAAGITVPVLAGVSWNQAMRRSRSADSDYVLIRHKSLPSGLTSDIEDRFWFAVDFLANEFRSSSGMFSSDTRNFELSGGSVFQVASAYGWGSREGTWISGFEAMRNICACMGLTPPRSLKPRPAQSRDLADGDFGAAGFNRGQADELAKRGVDAEVALEWRSEGMDPADVIRVIGLDPTTVHQWLEMGVDTYGIRSLVNAGVDPAAGRALVLAGASSTRLADFLLAGVTSAKFKEYEARGIAEELAAVLATNHIEPDEAARWQELGFRTWHASPLLRSGGNLEFAEALLANGVPLDNLSGWAATGMSVNACRPWIRAAISPSAAKELQAAGVTPAEAAPHWRKGRHNPKTIIRKITEASASPHP